MVEKQAATARKQRNEDVDSTQGLHPARSSLSVLKQLRTVPELVVKAPSVDSFKSRLDICYLRLTHNVISCGVTARHAWHQMCCLVACYCLKHKQT